MNEQTVEIKWEELTILQKIMFIPVAILGLLIATAIILPMVLIVVVFLAISFIIVILSTVMVIPLAVLDVITEKFGK